MMVWYFYLYFIFRHNNIFAEISLVDYSNWLLFGFLMGFGALLGDMTKSFFKRRLGYAPGKPFIPFDQLDFVVGALLFTYPLVKLPIGLVITTILLSFFLDIAGILRCCQEPPAKARWRVVVVKNLSEGS